MSVVGTDTYGQAVIMPITPATALPHSPVVFTFDPEQGTLTLTGTVTQFGIPNAPVRRKVVLVDEVSGRLVRETVSDALTGVYQFTNLLHRRYTVLAFDHTGLYRAVLADNLEPVP